LQGGGDLASRGLHVALFKANGRTRQDFGARIDADILRT
jgi:hypothetical protein